MSKRYFGTDGIRGRVGVAPVTAEFTLRLGWAAGRVLLREGRRSVVIGKDTRISGYMFESALEAGLSAAGADIALLGPMPTPAVAYLTTTLRAGAGIVISASHNPYEDNGIKFFGPDGGKLADSTEMAIEAMLDQPIECAASGALGKARRIGDAAGRYIEYCKGTLPFGTSLRGLDLVVDCANGATYQVAPGVLRELGARVRVIHAEPDGLNINRDCGSTAPASLQQAVVEAGADLGVAFDGDGDRVIMVDHTGSVVNGDQLLFLLARARRENGDYNGGVVGTVMSNLGLELALQELSIPFERVSVGDRHVHRRLLERGWLLGGESSGHILCLDRASTGDGIVTAVQVLNALVEQDQSLADATADMPRFPQIMLNVPVASRQGWQEDAAVVAAVKRAEAAVGRRGRVILRPSGTEPLIRVTVEGEDADLVERLARELADTVTDQLAGVRA